MIGLEQFGAGGGSRLMSRSSKSIPFASRKILITSQLRQPDWVKNKTLEAMSVTSTLRFPLEKESQMRQGNPEAHSGCNQSQNLYRSYVIRTS